MKKVAIYTRVSTDTESQANSFQVQKEYYTKWCEQNDYELYNLYGEKGLTGTNVRRPQFIQMMYDAGLDYLKNENGHDSFEKTDRKPKFNLIVCKDATRFSRHQGIGMQTIEYLRDRKVYVYFQNTALDTESDDWHMRASIMFMMAQNESHNKSRSVRFSKQHRARQGHYKTAKEPYGYSKNKDGELKINEKEAEIIRYIYDQFTEKGGHSIALDLNEKGIPTKQGHEWGHYHIIRIIRNELYTGTAVVNKFKKDNVTDVRPKPADESEYIRIPNAVDPIIDYNTWVKMNEIREQRTNKSTKRGRRPSINNPYQGKLYCANCGTGMIKHTKTLGGGKYRYSYMCGKRVNAKKCKMRAVSQSILDDFVGRITLSNLSDAMGNHYNLKVLNERIEQESGLLSERVQEMGKQIRELQTQSETLIDSLATSLVDSPQSVIDALSKRIDDNEKQIKQLQSQLNKTNIAALNELEKKVEKKTELIKELKNQEYIKLDKKIELASDIIVDEFEIEFNFTIPNYRGEIEEFNKLYPNDPIESSMGMKSFNRTIRREHKEAREFWEQVEHDYQESKDIDS